MKAPSLRVRLVRLTGMPAARLTFFALVALFVLLPVLERGGGMNLFHDAQFLSAYERHARVTVRAYGELPLWDPYTCGGLYGLAAPQTRYASPFFLLSIFLGVDRAGSLLLFLTAILGMEGTYAYARHRGARRIPAMLFAPVAACQGFYAFAFHFGWLQFASFQLVPFMLLGLRRALRGETRGAVMLAVSTAIATGVGGTYTLPMALVPMMVELASALVPSAAARKTERPRERNARLLRGALVGLMLTLAVGAYRLLPLFEAVPSTLRVMGGLPSFSVQTMAEYLFVPPTEAYSLAGQYYVGVAAIAIVPALFARRARPVWVMLVIAVALAFGHFADAAPFALLRRLPLYDMMRYPERNLVFVGFAVAVLAALGVSTLTARARLRRKKPLAVLAIALTAIALASVVELAHLARTWTTFMDVAPSPEERAGTFRQARGNRWILSHYVETGLGSLQCGEAYPVHMSTKLRGDLPAEEYLAEPGLGTVRRLAWSPNRIVLDVTLRAPTHLRVNQNFHPSWKSDVGRVLSDDGLLAVALPAGHHRVTLAFRPTSALFGALSTLAGLAVCGMLWRRRGAADRFAMVASVSPVIAALLLEGVLGDPLPRYPTPLTRDGAQVVLDALPRTATPLDVTFDTGLTLVGHEPIERTGPARGKVTLYFRRTGRVPASVAVFLHVRGAGERRGDHPALSAIVYPSRAPLGRIVRDEVDIDLPPPANGVLTISTGLWHAYGDQSRVRILNAHGARTHDDAVILELR